MAQIILKDDKGVTLEVARYKGTRQWCKVVLAWAEKYPDYALLDKDGKPDYNACEAPPGGSGHPYQTFTDHEDQAGTATIGGFWGDVLGATVWLGDHPLRPRHSTGRRRK